MAGVVDFMGELDGFGQRALTERRRHVAKLAAWMSENEEGALGSKISDVPDSVVSQTTMKKYFARKRTFGNQWGGVCNAVVEYMKENHQEPPDVVIRHAEAYKKARQAHTNEIGRTAHPSYRQDQFATWPEADLDEVVRTSTDLGLAVAAARFIVGKYLRAMRDPGKPAFDTDRGVDKRSASEKSLAAAQTITDLGQLILTRVSAPDTRPSERVLKDCVHIFSATEDAYRLRSRDRNREFHELHALHAFLRADYELTSDVRSPVEKIMTKYHCDATDALLSGDPDREVASVHTMLTELNLLVHTKGAKHRKSIQSDAFLAAAARVAAYALAYPSHKDTLLSCAELMVTLPTFSTKKHEVRILLDQAGVLGARTEIPTPTQLLRLARYRGVGEYLLAQALVRIARAHPDTSGVDTFLGTDPEAVSSARSSALQRAVVYYERAIEWLRSQGAAGLVREYASDDCAALKKTLRAESHAEHPQGGDAKRVASRMQELQTQLNAIIADTIIRTDFTDASDPTRLPYRLGASLKETIWQVLRVLDEPFALGTDLPVVEFPQDPSRAARGRAASQWPDGPPVPAE